MKLIQAIALGQPRKVNTKYGEKTVIDAIRKDNNKEITLWRPADDSYSQRFIVNGSPIVVAEDSKGKHSLIEDTNLVNLGKPETSPEPSLTRRVNHTDNVSEPVKEEPLESHLSPDQKRAIAQYVTGMADLFNFCLKTVDQRVENIEADDRRAIATTLYLSTTKQFNI